jgi:hypothetical protein
VGLFVILQLTLASIQTVSRIGGAPSGAFKRHTFFLNHAPDSSRVSAQGSQSLPS